MNIVISAALGTDWLPCQDIKCESPGDVPVRMFRKDICRIGEYRKVMTGQVIKVDAAVMKNWVDQFDAMNADGIKVPIPAKHRDEAWEARARSGDPRDNLGWVRRLWIDGDTLWMAAEIIGDDAITAVSRSDASVYSPPNFVSPEGKSYRRPLTHVAAVTDPLIKRLGDFIPIAASEGLIIGAIGMDFLTQLAEILGINVADFGDDEAAIQEAVLNALKDLIAKAQPSDQPEASPAASPTAPAAASDKPVRKETVTREYGMSEGMQSQVIDLIRKNREFELRGLLDAGQISAAQHKQLMEKYLGVDEIKASIGEDSMSAEEFGRVLAILKAGPTNAMRQQFGGQNAFEMSDSRKTDSGPNPLIEDAERKAKAYKARNGK